jgi:hypothetical protein
LPGRILGLHVQRETVVTTLGNPQQQPSSDPDT